jgi:hypothetical protein
MAYVFQPSRRCGAAMQNSRASMAGAFRNCRSASDILSKRGKMDGCSEQVLPVMQVEVAAAQVHGAQAS